MADASAGPAVRPSRAERRTVPDAGVASTLRSAPRLSRILRVLARHGFIGAVRGERHWPSPAQVREALEELGVVFLKFGQVLALRRDLLLPAYID